MLVILVTNIANFSIGNECVAWAKKIIQLSVCPINGMLVTITHNGFGLGEVAEH